MKKIHVVIIDDALYMRTVLRDIISKDSRFEIIGEGENGFEGIEEAKKKPDIMTLDITMPGLDGISALPEIKRSSPQTSILIVSALGKRSLIIKAIQEGADEFILKPFEKYRVLETLGKMAERRRRRFK